MPDFTVKHLSPMVPSRQLHLTRDFLVAALGFKLEMDDPQYVILQRDGFTLHLGRAEEPDAIPQMSFYLELDDLDAAWERVRQVAPEDLKLREPFIQHYGMREFHVVLPGTKALMFVGQVC